MDTIFIVDDQSMFANGIRTVLKRTYQTSVDVLHSRFLVESFVYTGHPIVIFVHYGNRTAGDNPEIFFKRRFPNIPMMVLFSSFCLDALEPLSKAGIEGFFLMDSPIEELIEAIAILDKGGYYIDSSIAIPHQREVEARNDRILKRYGLNN